MRLTLTPWTASRSRNAPSATSGHQSSGCMTMPSADPPYHSHSAAARSGVAAAESAGLSWRRRPGVRSSPRTSPSPLSRTSFSAVPSRTSSRKSTNAASGEELGRDGDGRADLLRPGGAGADLEPPFGGVVVGCDVLGAFVEDGDLVGVDHGPAQQVPDGQAGPPLGGREQVADGGAQSTSAPGPWRAWARSNSSPGLRRVSSGSSSIMVTADTVHLQWRLLAVTLQGIGRRPRPGRCR
ncbi:hypothetical protein [Spirillospora sp. CA-294931]|uniref:hypothetical protein n=1 Tax=Spirillospora sp. CA-294931 TaxID=3240042 RepID=UPI003D93079C